MLQDDAGPLDENQRELLEIIYNSSHSMLRMCNEILDITRIDAGRLQVRGLTMDARLADHVVNECHLIDDFA